MEGRLELLRHRRSGRRSLGRQPGHQDPGRQGRPGRGRDPPSRQHLRLLRRRTRRSRHVRRLPDRQEALAGLRHRSGGGLADRHRVIEGCGTLARQGPHGHHRRPLGPAGSRSHPRPPRLDQLWRFRCVLALSPATRTPARPPKPLPATTRRSHARSMRSLTEGGTAPITDGVAARCNVGRSPRVASPTVCLLATCVPAGSLDRGRVPSYAGEPETTTMDRSDRAPYVAEI